MITQIGYTNLRGRSMEPVRLTARTLVVGPNGSGKTTLVMAAQLALLGYVPGYDKTAAAIFAHASGESMSCTAEIDDKTIVSRTWSRKRDTISATVCVGGVAGTGKNADGMVRLALGGKVPVVDVEAFFALSPRQQLLAVLAASGAGEALIVAESEAREALARIRASVKDAEAAAQRVAQSLAALPTVPTDIARIDADLAALQVQRDTMKALVEKGEDNAKLRKALQTAIDGLPMLRGEYDTEQTRVVNLRDEMTVLTREIDRIEITPVRSSRVDEDVAVELRGIAQRLRYVGGSDVCTLADEVDAIANAGESEAVKLARHDALARKGTLQATLDTKRQQLDRALRRAGDLKAQGQAVREKQKQLTTIGAAATDEDRAALAGCEDRLRVLLDVRDAAKRRQTLQAEVEKANVFAEQQREAAENAAVKARDAASALSGAVDPFAKALGSSGIVPGHGLVVVDEPFSIRAGGLPRQCLSGSERVLFDAAVGVALLGGKGTVFIDAGECSNTTLEKGVGPLLDSLAGDVQVVLCRWTDDEVAAPVMGGFSVVAMGNATGQRSAAQEGK